MWETLSSRENMAKCGAKATLRGCTSSGSTDLSGCSDSSSGLLAAPCPVCGNWCGSSSVLWPLTPVCDLTVFSPVGHLHICGDGHMMSCRDMIMERSYEMPALGIARVSGARSTQKGASVLRPALLPVPFHVDRSCVFSVQISSEPPSSLSLLSAPRGFLVYPRVARDLQ